MFPKTSQSGGIISGGSMGWIVALFLCCSCFGSTLGYLGSLADGPPYPRSAPGCCGGYVRIVHPRLGEIKSPVLPYSRVSRDPSQNTKYFNDDENSRYANFLPPSFQHKNINRMSKFHNGGRGLGKVLPLTKVQIFGKGPAGHQQQQLQSSPTLEELLHSINNANSGEHGLDNDEAPTFTPYIGARALSNMKEFFEHLQENIEALRKDEDEGEDEYVGGGSTENGSMQNDGTGAAAEVRASPSIDFRSVPQWKPHALGDHGLKKIRSFLPFINQETTRSRLGTNLGLGKRRRR